MGGFGSWFRQRMEPGGARNRIVEMESLRGVAVILVFCVHYVSVFRGVWGHGSLAGLGPLLTIGTYGVDLFFLISGYLIYGAVVEKKVAYFHFMKRRLERLYPVFIVMFLAYVALSFAFPSESKLPDGTAQRALYLTENLLMLPGLLPIRPMMTVAWSLSFEIFFYLSVPLAVACFGFRRWPRQARLSSLAAFALALLAVCHAFGLTLHDRMALFVAGAALFELKKLREESGPAPWVHRVAVGLALIALPVGYLLEVSPRLGTWAEPARTLWLAVALLPVLYSAFSGTGPLSRVLRWRPLRWLGNMSYSYYLLHALLVKGFGLFAAHLAPGLGVTAYWAFLPVAFLLTLPFTVVLYLLVELPISIERRTPRRLVPQPVSERP